MKIEIDKPVIPQFVADWIESNSSGFNIRGALEEIDSWTTPDILDWCRKVDGELSYKTLVTAYLYGYEIEQDPRYYAKIKGWEISEGNIHWDAIVKEKVVFPQDKSHVGLRKTKLTKAEWNKLGINETNADFEKVEE